MTDEPKQPYPEPSLAESVQVQSEFRAKQGRTGWRILAILAISLVLAVAALFGLWGLHAPQLAKPGVHGSSQTTSPADANRFNTAEPSPRSN